MIIVTALLGLAAPIIGTQSVEPQTLPNPQVPQDWYETMIRRDTARRIAADLPKAPMRFRFECGYVPRGVQFIVNEKFCVREGDQRITDPVLLKAQARIEAATIDTTVEDRLRRTAWLRVMLRNTTQASGAADKFETSVVEEVIAASDLDGLPPSTADTAPAKLVFTRKIPLDYPATARRAGTQGRIELQCVVITGGQIQCETITPYFADPIMYPSGQVRPPDLLILVAAAHRWSHGILIGPKTVDGRDSLGLRFPLALNFSLNQDF